MWLLCPITSKRELLGSWKLHSQSGKKTDDLWTKWVLFWDIMAENLDFTQKTKTLLGNVIPSTISTKTISESLSALVLKVTTKKFMRTHWIQSYQKLPEDLNTAKSIFVVTRSQLLTLLLQMLSSIGFTAINLVILKLLKKAEQWWQLSLQSLLTVKSWKVSLLHTSPKEFSTKLESHLMLTVLAIDHNYLFKILS